MNRQSNTPTSGRGPSALPYRPFPPITFAFQPIVNARQRSVVAYEALVRGPQGEGAASIINEIAPEDLASFDEHCRTSAMGLAARLGMSCDLNLNLVTNGFHADRDCLASTLDASIQHDFLPDRLVVEVTEAEILGDQQRFTELLEVYRGLGMRLAIDNFGSGYSGLNLMADLRPDQIKLDKTMARDISTPGPRQAIVRGIVQVCRELNVELVAEGIETNDEFAWLCNNGVELFQGYLFGRPGFEALPPVHIPECC